MNIPAFTHLPMQIDFHNMAYSATVETNLHERAAQLQQFRDIIKRFRVTINAPQKHPEKGIFYHVEIDITVPDAEIVVSHDPELNHAHEDIYVAIRNAMDCAQRKLETYTMKRHGKLKTRQPASTMPGRLLD